MPGPMKPMTPLSEREMRMLLSLIEVEREKADAITERWKAEPEEGYEDGPAALATERDYAMGVSSGIARCQRIIAEVLNA
jgi:hypothetical protein